MADFSVERPCRILSLDGGGAKGFYSLGVLREIEGMVKCPLHQKFDLIFGTSTGAIIAALLALGRPVEEISELYEKNVPTVMRWKNRADKSAARVARTVGLGPPSASPFGRQGQGPGDPPLPAPEGFCTGGEEAAMTDDIEEIIAELEQLDRDRAALMERLSYRFDDRDS